MSHSLLDPQAKQIAFNLNVGQLYPPFDFEDDAKTGIWR